MPLLMILRLSELCLTHQSRFHHHLVNGRRQMRFLKGSATARTLGFLPLALSSLMTTMGSKIYQRGAHYGCAPEIEELYHGNRAYIANTNPGLLQSLAKDGQSAYCPFVYFINLTFSPCFTRAPVYAGRLFR